MRALRSFLVRLSGSLRRGEALDRELDEEIRSNIELHIEDNLRAGMTPEQARRQALLKFGGIEAAKEAYRDRRGLPVLESLVRRTRFAVRALAKTPLVVAVVVVSLALGIGANTAIFSLLHQFVLRSLPVERPEELVFLSSPEEFKSGRSSTDNSGASDAIFSYRIFRELEKRPEGVTTLAAFRNISANLSFETQTVNSSAMLTSGRYFSTLGIQPLFGRLIAPEDDVHGAGNPVAVLGFGYWHDRLGGRTEVLNQPIRVNGQVFTIVGVAPRDFTGTTFGSGPAVFVPLSFKPRLTPGWDGTANYDDYWLYLFARLKPGVSREQAESALNSVYAGLVEEQAKTIRRDASYVERFLASRLSLHEGSRGRSMGRDGRQTSVSILMIATGLVLLIAIANAANLLLARSVERRKDLAIQAALGASRSDIMGQWLTEAFLVAAASGLMGVVLGSWTLNVLVRSMAGDEAPVYHLTTRLEWPVLLFAMGASALTGLLVGLYPAWDAARHSVAATLKEDSGASSSRGSARVRKSLVVMQVAVSALLLIPTGLFLKSLVNLLQVDLGFRTESLITFRISPQLNAYTLDQCRALYERIEEQLAAIPGVRAATSSMVPLIDGNNWGNSLTVEGFPNDPDADRNSMFNMVGPGFFGRMGIPLVAGRELTEKDNRAGAKVALVNETFARHIFGDANPIGRKFTPGTGDVIPDIEIVGVVRDTKYSEVKQTSPPLYYQPWRQSDDLGSMSYYIRTELDPHQTMIDIKTVMATLDRDLPVQGLRTMEDQVRRSIRSDRMVLQLTAVFALLATSMAMLGLYGVMAYSVNRRTREIGIRLALGARTGSIRAMVMRELLLILAGGLAIGVPAALLVTRYAEGQLFGVTSRDGTVIAAAVSALALAALAAAYFPARRATRVNPLMALRHE